MYTTRNFKTKKELKEAVKRYLALTSPKVGKITSEPALNAVPVTLYAPGLGELKRDGIEFVEEPHFPEPHRWYAQVKVVDGIVVEVK